MDRVSTHPTFGLVIPMFDEAERVRESVPAIIDYIRGCPEGSEVVFVDDGSTDGTADVVDELIPAAHRSVARVLRLEHRGKGGALRDGILACDADTIGFCDIDLSTPLEELSRLREIAERSPVLAIASRETHGARLIRRQEAFRELMGRLYNRLVQLLLVPGILDTQCGAKVAVRKIWEEVLPVCHEVGFAWDVEVVAAAKAMRFDVLEVGVRWQHDPRSRVRFARDGMAMLLALFRIRGRVSVLQVGRAARRASGVFGDENAEAIAEHDASHWWFRSKASVVSWALRRWSGSKDGGRLLDVGAASGGVTSMLGWPADRLLLVEGSERLIAEARTRHGLLGVAGSADSVPMAEGSAEVVTLLDVIEHVPDSSPLLQEARRLIAPGGRLIVTVPAHRWLWSGADVLLGHHRRYTRRSLTRELRRARFRVMFCSHFFSWLIPPVLVKRRMTKDPKQQLGLDVGSPAIDRLALIMQRIERSLLRLFPLPFGTSIICIAEPDHSIEGRR